MNIPHDRLIAEEKWESCLGCHDFHGNHVFEPPTRVQAMIPGAAIRAYFHQGAGPYGTFKHFEAKPE